MSSERIGDNSEILKRISGNYPSNSREYQALKISALAFSYVVLKCEKEFDDFVDGLWKPLTPKESAELDKLSSKTDKPQR